MGNSNAAGLVLQASNVSKRVNLGDQTIHILTDVSLSIEAQQSVAIVGSSGSGKTTLLGLLAGLDSPSSGAIDLLGASLESLDEDERAALRNGKVGFVFQSFHLLPNLTALENVQLALEVVHRSENITERALSALDKVGLSERGNHLPSQLSGGEQQRVALARAIVIGPSLLFADEPTGNLDHGTRDQVCDLLFSLCNEIGCTLVLVTHDSDLASRCDRIFRLDGGRLVS